MSSRKKGLHFCHLSLFVRDDPLKMLATLSQLLFVTVYYYQFGSS